MPIHIDDEIDLESIRNLAKIATFVFDGTSEDVDSVVEILKLNLIEGKTVNEFNQQVERFFKRKNR